MADKTCTILSTNGKEILMDAQADHYLVKAQTKLKDRAAAVDKVKEDLAE